jgi:GxxExxY protein
MPPFNPDRVAFRHGDGSPLSDQLEHLIHRVIGCGITVHRTLGPGYLESCYEEAMAIEMTHQRINYERQKPFVVQYRDQRVAEGRLDFLVERELVLELKAVRAFTPVDEAQAIAYLRATGNKIALLMNFNVPILKDGIRRIIL